MAVDSNASGHKSRRPTDGKAGSRPENQSRSQTKNTARRGQVKPPPRLYAPGPLIDGEAALTAGLEALAQRDPQIVVPMRAACGTVPLRARHPGFEGLVWIVLSQQVSVASADAIAARVKAGVAPLAPATILAASDETLRACGLSAPKMRILRAISVAIESGALDLESLGGLDPAAAHEALVAVKGIGPWTADIFLLFCLGHPDAWPAGDLALQEAARIALGLKSRPDTAGLERIGERWRPWRGVAARLLWAYYGAVKGRGGMALAKDEADPGPLRKSGRRRARRPESAPH